MRFGFCVKAEPAAVFARLLVLPVRSVFDAAVAALPDVTLAGAFLCDSADPAADFAVLLVDLLRSTFDAALAARLLVCSLFLAISTYLCFVCELLANIDRRRVVEHEKRENNEESREYDRAYQAGCKTNTELRQKTVL